MKPDPNAQPLPHTTRRFWLGGLLTLLVFVTVACSQSALDKLTGDSEKSWSLENRKLNGVAQGLDICDRSDVVIFKKGGTLMLYDRIADSTGCRTLRYDGTWVLSNGDKNLAYTLAATPTQSIYLSFTVLELTSTRLRLQYTDSLGTWELMMAKS